MLTKGILADSCQPDDAADAGEPTGLVISMPMDGFSEAALDNLRKLVESKANAANVYLGDDYGYCPKCGSINREILEILSY